MKSAAERCVCSKPDIIVLEDALWSMVDRPTPPCRTRIVGPHCCRRNDHCNCSKLVMPGCRRFGRISGRGGMPGLLGGNGGEECVGDFGEATAAAVATEDAAAQEGNTGRAGGRDGDPGDTGRATMARRLLVRGDTTATGKVPLPPGRSDNEAPASLAGEGLRLLGCPACAPAGRAPSGK